MLIPPTTLREELHGLLVQRIRLGAGLISVTIVLFGALELWQQRAPLGLFFAVKAVQVAAVVAVCLALDPERPWRRSVLLALALVGTISATQSTSSILAGEVASAPLLAALVTMGTATLLPWGLVPQAATIVLAAGGLVANSAFVPLPDGFGYTVTAAVVAFVTSLCVTYELDQQRHQRLAAEREERMSASALRDEVVLAERAAHAARELLAGGDGAQVLARLCRTTTRLLACDASYTFVPDTADGHAFVAVASDGDSGSDWVSQGTLRMPDGVLAGLRDRLDRDEPVVVGGRDVLPVDGTVCLYTALFAGREVAAIHVAVRRRAAPFSPDEIELARRLAHTASAALAQARLLESADASRPPVEATPRVWRELQTPLSSILRLAERAADLSLPAAERRALLTRLASTARDTLRLLERLEQGDRGSATSQRTLRG